MAGLSPLVSVVLPTYNRAATLPRAIATVLNQSWRDVELLVVDDGSTDGTAALVNAIGDPRVRYLPLSRNGGVSAARNAGILAARGKLIAFQDSDDEWLPDFLEKQLAALEQLGQDTAIVMCCSICPENSERSFPPLPGRERVADAGEHLLRHLPHGPCWLARRESLLRAGLFDTGLDCFEEWELALRVSDFARVGLLNETLHVYHSTPGSLISNEAGFVRNLECILARHSAKLSAQPRDLAGHQTVAGHMAVLYGDAGQGRRWFRAAIRTAPGRPRAWLSYAVSLCGRPIYRLATKLFRRGRRLVYSG